MTKEQKQQKEFATQFLKLMKKELTETKSMGTIPTSKQQH